jgi:multidrug efflux pump subunit AcrB
MLLVTIGLIVLTGFLYVVIPKGFLPEQDTGIFMGEAQARQGHRLRCHDENRE